MACTVVAGYQNAGAYDSRERWLLIRMVFVLLVVNCKYASMQTQDPCGDGQSCIFTLQRCSLVEAGTLFPL